MLASGKMPPTIGRIVLESISQAICLLLGSTMKNAARVLVGRPFARSGDRDELPARLQHAPVKRHAVSTEVVPSHLYASGGHLRTGGRARFGVRPRALFEKGHRK
jgi:hypothetical protein